MTVGRQFRNQQHRQRGYAYIRTTEMSRNAALANPRRKTRRVYATERQNQRGSGETRSDETSKQTSRSQGDDLRNVTATLSEWELHLVVAFRRGNEPCLPLGTPFHTSGFQFSASVSTSVPISAHSQALTAVATARVMGADSIALLLS